MADPRNKDYDMEVLDNDIEKEKLDKEEERIRRVIENQIKDKEELIIERELYEEINVGNNMVDRSLFDQFDNDLSYAISEVNYMKNSNKFYNKIIKWKKEIITSYDNWLINEKRKRIAAAQEMEQIKKEMKAKDRELFELKTGTK